MEGQDSINTGGPGVEILTDPTFEGCADTKTQSSPKPSDPTAEGRALKGARRSSGVVKDGSIDSCNTHTLAGGRSSGDTISEQIDIQNDTGTVLSEVEVRRRNFSTPHLQCSMQHWRVTRERLVLPTLQLTHFYQTYRLNILARCIV